MQRVKIKPVHMQLAYMKKRLEELAKYQDAFTTMLYYEKLVKMNEELKECLREWKKLEKEKVHKCQKNS